MGGGRQKDHCTPLVRRRRLHLQVALKTVSSRRQMIPGSAISDTKSILTLAAKFSSATNDYHYHLLRVRRISHQDFSFNFNCLTDRDYLHNFRFQKRQISQLVSVMSWSETQTRTSRNEYRASPILATCIMLRRLATPSRWGDLEELFGKHVP